MNMRSLDSLYRSLGQVVLPLCLLLMVKLVMAQTGAGFDHDATAFPLLGSHQQVRCESCHIKGIFKATPRDCAGCHVVNNQRGAMAMPYKHIQTSSTCDTCHNSNSFAAVLFTHVNVMPGTCNTCHDGNRAIGQPAGHFPTNLSCDACHVTSVFKPVRQFPHAVLGGDLSSCASCHNGLTATGMPANHLPRTSPAQCGNCHINSTLNGFMSFSGGQMDHTGMGSGCADCHGPSITGSSFAGISSIVVMPPTSPAGANSHIPSSITCESCHLASMPAGLISANASLTPPGSGFATPPPGNAQIHAGVTGGCSSCHETNSVWMSVGNYPISPSTLVAKAQYTGFQTRPQAAAGTYNIADAAHPSSGDCGQCHGNTNYFSSEESRPANHIPISTSAQCNSCHTTSDFSVLPSLANIHANAPSTTGNCAQCHAANVVAGFAIPAANFVIVGPPANHLPTTAACESCHVGSGSSIASLPVGNGAKFSGSLMSHTGITSNCVSCHGPGITGSSFAGVSNIVVMPATSPVGTGSHIPSSTTCESCHLGTVPSGLVAASATKSAPGTLFATPAPTTTQIHTGITSGCSSCHDTNYVWMGVTAYPIAPTVLTSGAQYTGFQTRPKAAAGTYNIADAAHPATGDCSLCHTGTNYFSGAAKPTGHIPTTQSCATCHLVSGDFSIAGLASTTALHTGISSGCITCHSAGAGAGPFAGCTTQAACASPPPVTYQPKVTPLAAGGSPTAPSASTHVPTVGISCEKCHSATVFTSFVGMNMKGNTAAHTAVGAATCESCHEYPYVWYGVTIKTPGSTSHHGRAAGQDCTACHNKSYSQFSGQARVRPVLRGALNPLNQRFLPGIGLVTSALFQGNLSAFTHTGVLPGQCQTCHNGQMAQGMPARHLLSRLSCDSCHRTTAWKPAQFNHQGVIPGQCQSCHNSAVVKGKPAGHFVTAKSCDACHRTVTWVPVSYSHISPSYQPQVGKFTCVSCHVTNGELIPRQMRGNNRPSPVPVRTVP